MVVGVTVLVAGLAGCAGGPPQRDTGLFLGQDPGCNAGVVTTEADFMNCRTELIGYTIHPHDQAQEPLYVGMTPGVNDGIVSRDPVLNGGKTRPIGYVASEAVGGTRLYVGSQPGCNEGVVAAEPDHRGCHASPIGWTHPSRGAEPLPGALSSRGAVTGPERDTILYLTRSTQPECPTGMVSTGHGHMNCEATPIGFTVKPGRSQILTPLYVGVVPGVNSGMVTTDPRLNEGETRPIGSTTTQAYGGNQLYVGIRQGCNQGIVSGTANLNGCETAPIGWTAPGTGDVGAAF